MSEKCVSIFHSLRHQSCRESWVGFEPTRVGFANRSVNHFATRTGFVRRTVAFFRRRDKTFLSKTGTLFRYERSSKLATKQKVTFIHNWWFVISGSAFRFFL